jgi:hypothetical protein
MRELWQEVDQGKRQTSIQESEDFQHTTHPPQQAKKTALIGSLVPKFKLINQVINLNSEILPAWDHSLGTSQQHVSTFPEQPINERSQESEDFQQHKQPTQSHQSKKITTLY